MLQLMLIFGVVPISATNLKNAVVFVWGVVSELPRSTFLFSSCLLLLAWRSRAKALLPKCAPPGSLVSFTSQSRTLTVFTLSLFS
jgi:hypothetical protein